MFYAKYVEADREVMAFKTRAERDNWTGFKDEISIVCGTTADNATFQREPLTSSEAAAVVGRKNLFDKSSREEHEILKGVFVILAF